jgi:Mg2+/citrate symporter
MAAPGDNIPGQLPSWWTYLASSIPFFMIVADSNIKLDMKRVVSTVVSLIVVGVIAGLVGGYVTSVKQSVEIKHLNQMVGDIRDDVDRQAAMFIHHLQQGQEK